MKRVLLSAATLFAFSGAALPSLPIPAAAQVSSAEATGSAGVVNINTATAEELKLLPGVGTTRAQAIIAARQRRPFRRTREIMRVRGIGRATYRRLASMLAIEGPTTLRSHGR